MAEQQITGQHRPHGQQQLRGGEAGTKGSLLDNKGGPSSSQVVAVAALFPVGGILLTLAGLTLTATVVGLALVTPLFVVFSPVLVPAAAVIGLALLGFLTAGVLGVGALSAFSWIVMNCVRRQKGPEHYVELARRRGQEAAGYVGQRTKDVGQAIQEGAGGGRSSTT